ncbi:MAG: leucine--tRNA ligase [Bacteroidales bacterium]
MEYNHIEIEKKWQEFWKENSIYKTEIDSNKPKFYVLDMFPYPSGAGLHVGHPLGYIASDIYSRFKRLKGFNVLHPMGYDAYGLPAEQYAIQTGQHPEVTTVKNIERYREQLEKIGFCYDWSREIRTCDANYYKWTQWAFIKMFNSYYDNSKQKACDIDQLIAQFEKSGSKGINAACSKELDFTAEEWNVYSKKDKSITLMNYRIAYLGETMVNWCAKLGTVLANDEVSEGVSERGGYPVEQKLMKQWCLRVSAYAPRLLDGLNTVEWTDSLKETQRNWIGYSEGAEMKFPVTDSDLVLDVFTTRADTIYGVTFMVLAPESAYTKMVVTDAERANVDDYVAATKRKTERERMIDKRVTGAFTGSYAINPVTGKQIPIWVSDYVLAGYGTGAIMAVPAHDSRDYAFAKKFDLEIIPLIEGCDVSEESFDAKEGIMMNSSSMELKLDGMQIKEAIAATKIFIETKGIGKVKINYRLRDAIFSRQRYWGEPFPVYYDEDNQPQVLDLKELPLLLPEVSKFLPTETGEPPLARAENWVNKDGFPLEMCTMPGFAGSSAYYLRYMDPTNDTALVSQEANEYWRNVDLYIGGTEHATGHLIYSRFWNKFLYDFGVICEDEPFRKLINQGMIQGRSNFVYRIKDSNRFVSYNLKGEYDTTELHVDVNIVSNDVLDINKFRAWRPEFKDAEFILEGDKYVCGWAVEKMSKSMFNVVNPDDIVDNYGADTLRLYEMFLGPLEQSKPWDTNGIDGVNRFLKKLWALFYKNGAFVVTDGGPTKDELKALHKLIKKVSWDIENFSFNTSISAFMICVNELNTLKCNKRAILNEYVKVITPFAPHIAEELWHILGNETTVCDAQWPEFNEEYLKESVVNYAISFNGKARFSIEFAADTDRAEIERVALAHESSQKWIDGKTPKKVIVVPNKIVNIVL